MTGARELLLKFRGDLSQIKEHFKGIDSMVKQTNASMKSARDKAHSEEKTSVEEISRLARQQNQIQISLIKAKQKAMEAETKYEKSLAASQLKRLSTKANEIRLQQQLITLKEKQVLLDSKPPSHIKELFKSFTGAATGGGLLNTIIAGAAGGGAFLVFEKLSEKIGEVVKSFAEMPLKAGEMAEQLEKAAARAGVTTQQFQQLKLVAAESDLSMQTMTRALMMMSLQFTRAGGGISRTEKELLRFGVSIRDTYGNVLPATDIIKRVSDLFQQLPDGMTKSRLAADLFTRRIGSQMIPLLNQGSGSIQELYDRSEKYSILVNEDILKAQRNWQVETAALKMQWEQFEFALGQGVLPLLVKVLSLINEVVEAMNQTSGINTPKQFAEDIETWARSKGMMAGKPQLQMSSEGRNKMKEVAPIALQEAVYKQVFGNQAGGAYQFDTSWEKLYTDLRNAGKPTNDLIQSFATTFPDALETSTKKAEGLDKRLQDNTKTIAALQNITFKYNETLAQFREKQEEANIQAKQFELKTQYDQGLIAQEEYIQRSKELDKEQHDSKVKYLIEFQKIEIEKTQAAAKTQIEQMGGEEPAEGMDKVSFAAEQQDKIKLVNEQTAEKIKIIKVQTNTKLLEEDEKYKKQTQQLDIEYIVSKQKALDIGFKDNLKAQEESLTQQKTLLDYQLNQNIISVDAYMTERRHLIEEEINLSKTAAQQEYDVGKKTLESLANLRSKQREADAKGEKDLTELLRSEVQSRVEFSQRRFSNRTGFGKSQLDIAEATPGAGGVDQARAAMQLIIDATRDYKNEQSDLLKKTQPLSEEWYKIISNIQKATLEIRKMETELSSSRSILSNSGNLLGMFGGFLGNIGVTRGGVGNIGAAGSLLGQLGARESAGKGNVFTDVTDTFKSINWHDLSDAFQKLSKGLGGAISAVGSFASILGSSKGHIGDILGGGLAGAGVGKDIGSMFSKFGKMAGPIGEIAGAAFGGILSGIIGQKNNRTQEYINSVNKQMQDLEASISNGTTGLQAGIQQLQSLRQSVLGEMGHSKKKQKAALEQEAEAINNEIIQLQRQVEAMFIDLGNQLKVLNAPNQFQPLLSSLNDIFQQYKKFQGAARDAKDLAMANQFLADSLSNFAETQEVQLNQAEQTAIQDALKLNDLLVQRQELLTNEAQTEYDIMTQGVLINQRTIAQQKMSQIQQARNQFNIQMEKINNEISMTTYKVDSERKIFDIATTRIGLEAQLLVLQAAQTDKEMLKIAALQQVVKLLQSGQSFSNIDQLLSALGLSSKLPTSTPDFGGGGGIDRGDLSDLLNNIRNRQGASGWGSTIGYLNS